LSLLVLLCPRAGAAGPDAVAVAQPLSRDLPRVLVDAAYQFVSFPIGGLVQHGASVGARTRFERVGEAALRVGLFAPLEVNRPGVSADLWTATVEAEVGARLSRRRFTGTLGGVGELVFVTLDASGAGARSTRQVAPGLGVALSGRVRLFSRLWLSAGLTVVGVLLGERFTIRGERVFDVTDLQLTGRLGLDAAVW
jgi:hypothetical protein